MNKKKRKQQQEELERQLNEKREEISILKKKSIKELIAPSGIDVSNIDHLEIISSTKRYARSFFASSLAFPSSRFDWIIISDELSGCMFT